MLAHKVCNISIYVHWPFCLSLCPYCDFNSHVAEQIDQQQWLDSYIKEINHFAYKIKGRNVASIFFGGGTPSLMQPYVVEGIINEIAKLASLDNSCEITLEANPTSYEASKFQEFKKAGINRISLGIQSLKDADLKTLGRKHSAREAIAAIKSASTIFSNYSFDLIYARPNQTLEEWQEEMKLALELAGSHLSLYQLTIEKGTPFFTLFRSKQMSLPADDVSANMYEWTNDYLNSNGYQRYEISNYAKDGKQCRHNLCYWHYGEYIGIGPGAHSRLHGKTLVETCMMLHSPDKWLASVAKDNQGIQLKTKLTQTELVEEIIMMGTRLESGIIDDVLYQLSGLKFADILDLKTIEQYMEQGLLSLQDNILRLTDKGLLLHNYIIPRVLASSTR